MTLNHKDTSAISPEEALPTKEFQPVETHCEQKPPPRRKDNSVFDSKKKQHPISETTSWPYPQTVWFSTG
ncbi:hypothetical protein [Acidovorax temperans]|uniref:hypothetical protein n=1 Tax=Acidovorax temperans TaxID=80878 RepID=UPI0012EDAF0E|nr:hypothetical protein [Acidovorax temperans]